MTAFAHPRATPAIVSASRLTDVPRFYAAWFANRRRAGTCVSGNSFGGRYRISLRSQDVLAYLFWTRDARPLLPELDALLAEGLPAAFQFTITAYGGDLEENRVPLGEQLESFRAVAARLPGPSAIQLRYDPVVVGGPYTREWHEESLDRLCRELRGCTRVVNTSLCEPYRKVLARLDRLRQPFAYRRADPGRHPTVGAEPRVLADPLTFLRRLSAIASDHGMQLRACANPELSGGDRLPPAQCCGLELFAEYPAARLDRLRTRPRGPSRPGCNCLATADIGMTDTCPGGCLYCYATGALRKSLNFFGRHDPTAESLR